MLAGFIAQMVIILIFAGLLIYGYTKKDEVIDWEQRIKRKLFRYIYKKIVAYENWRDLRKAGVKSQDIKNTLFEDTYHYYDAYQTFKSIFKNENHDLVKAMRTKYFSCHCVIQQSGLEDLYQAFCENKQKNNRVSGN